MLNSIIHLFQSQSTNIINALEEHILLSFVSVLIAAVIAISLAILFMNHRKLGNIMLQIAGIIQTIPSLAVLGALIPLVGIGTVPAIIALVLYAFMPIYQNTYSGLTNIDPSLLEAAESFGLSKSFKLFKIRLPLAMSEILSGLRVATVTVIGTATLAALIGGGGLGTFIMQGIQNGNNAELLLGAILSALLAIVFSWLLNELSKVSFKKLIVIVSAILALGVGFFTVQHIMQSSEQTITVAGKLGSEPEVLMNMYKELIENEDPKLKVQTKPNFGNTNFLFKAIKNKQVDIYPEFTGTVLETLHPQKVVSHQPGIAYNDAKNILKRKDNLDYLKPMSYQNRYTIAVRRGFAKKHHLKTISDLAKISSKYPAAFDSDFYQQHDGYQGLKKKYNLHFVKIKVMEPNLRYEAIAHNQISVVDGYTTDPQLKADNLVSLKDDESFFPPYQGAPLVNPEILNKYPAIKTALNKLAGKITEKDMINMNYEVTIKHEKASTVARRYLIKNKLIKK